MADTPTASAPDENPSRPTRHPPLSNADVEAIIAGFIQLRVNLITSKHFRKQAAHRNVAVSDAIEILTNGTVIGKPEWNEKYGDWTYAIRGQDVEGDELELRIGVEPEGSAMVLVTIYEPN